VSEGFRQRYLDAASKIEATWLLSALNILSESEINFRQAKNKRLHVELTLIKLCYLNQALELVNDKGQLSKKKQVENVKPVSFRALAPVAEKIKNETLPTSASSKEKKISNKPSGNVGNVTPQKDEALLIIEKEIMKPAQPKAVSDNTTVVKVKPLTRIHKLNSLKEIREKVALENKNHQVVELNEEELYIAWGLYIDELIANKNHSAVSNFRQAKLDIVDENCIEIITDNNLQQKFIEAERGALITHLQSHFNNRFLTYKVVVVENQNKNELREEHLSTRQQYLKIIEEYPLVKQLKDNLGLQLDY
jgi:DNA polymerase-3 subunit gamma/tau